MPIAWVHGVGQSPVCQILLQIAVRMLVTASPPACINPIQKPSPDNFKKYYTTSMLPPGDQLFTI